MLWQMAINTDHGKTRSASSRNSSSDIFLRVATAHKSNAPGRRFPPTD